MAEALKTKTIVEDVSLDDLKQGLADGSVVLVDVREPHEYFAGHIPGSSLNALQSFDTDALPPPQPGKTIVFSCRSGRRSITALGLAQAAGRDDIRAFMTDFRAAFPDLNFWGTADLIAEGDYVVGQWEGGGMHTGPAFGDFLVGSLPAATGRKMHFTGTTVLKLTDGRIVEEIGLDDGVTALTQLGLIKPVEAFRYAL